MARVDRVGHSAARAEADAEDSFALALADLRVDDRRLAMGSRDPHPDRLPGHERAHVAYDRAVVAGQHVLAAVRGDSIGDLEAQAATLRRRRRRRRGWRRRLRYG